MHESEASTVVEFVRGFPQPNKIGKIVVVTEKGRADIKPNPARWTQLQRHLTANNGHCRLEVYNQDGTKVFEGETATICKGMKPAADTGGVPPAVPPVAMVSPQPPRPIPAAPAPWVPLPLPAQLPNNISESMYGMMVLFDMQSRAQHVYREDVLREQRELLAEVKNILALPLEALARVNDSQASRIAGLETLVGNLLRQYGKPVIVGGPTRQEQTEPADPEAPTMGSKVGRVVGDLLTGAMLQLGSNIAGEADKKEETKNEQETAT